MESKKLPNKKREEVNSRSVEEILNQSDTFLERADLRFLTLHDSYSTTVTREITPCEELTETKIRHRNGL